MENNSVLKNTQECKRGLATLYDDDKVGSVKYFIFDESDNLVYAVLKQYLTHVESELKQLSAGKHLISVRPTEVIDVVPVEQLEDTLININVDLSNTYSFVVRMPNDPNDHGHAIFK